MPSKQLRFDDDFMMNSFKIKLCPRLDHHNWKHCPWRHEGEFAAQRRHPSLYKPPFCTNLKMYGSCAAGNGCPFSHNTFEMSLHPERYKTSLCSLGGKCNREICFFAHSAKELRSPSTPDPLPGTPPEPAADGPATEEHPPDSIAPTVIQNMQAPLAGSAHTDLSLSLSIAGNSRLGAGLHVAVPANLGAPNPSDGILQHHMPVVQQTQQQPQLPGLLAQQASLGYGLCLPTSTGLGSTTFVQAGADPGTKVPINQQGHQPLALDMLPCFVDQNSGGVIAADCSGSSGSSGIAANISSGSNQFFMLPTTVRQELLGGGSFTNQCSIGSNMTCPMLVPSQHMQWAERLSSHGIVNASSHGWGGPMVPVAPEQQQQQEQQQQLVWPAGGAAAGLGIASPSQTPFQSSQEHTQQLQLQLQLQQQQLELMMLVQQQQQLQQLQFSGSNAW